MLRYLKGTTNFYIMFNIEHRVPLVVGHVDSDYAGDLNDMRSTIGMSLLLIGAISWKSSAQSTIAMFTIEAEYMTVAKVTKEAL